MTPRTDFEDAVKRDVEARVREDGKAVSEEILEEEMTEHLEASYEDLLRPGKERYPMVISVFGASVGDVLAYPRNSGSHLALICATKLLERFLEEVKGGLRWLGYSRTGQERSGRRRPSQVPFKFKE